MTKRVLLNLYEYGGIEDLLKNLQNKYGFSVYATDLSFENLKKYGFNAEKYDEEDISFDIVICNFFDFERYVNRNTDEEEVLKHFDTKGLSLLQKYSANFNETLVVTAASQFEQTEEYVSNGCIDETLRRKYAQQALALICKINSDFIGITGGGEDFISINAQKIQTLMYGENPHQRGFLYDGNKISYEIIDDKELSYNNILDINLATAIAAEFYDVNAAVITRHAMPCAAALGSTPEDAFAKATDCDPVSAMGGVVAFSREVDKKTAKILSSMFVEVIIAPNFSDGALELLGDKELKLIKINTPLKDYKKYLQQEIIRTPFGTLVQDFDNSELVKNTFKVVSKKKPTTEIVEDMVFAWKIAKHTRSNSAVVVKNLQTVGIAQGETNKIEAIDIALDRACEKTKDAILATDGFIATKDGIFDAAQARIAGIIQPGGSKRDKEIISAVDKYEITMITTGLRQYRHK